MDATVAPTSAASLRLSSQPSGNEGGRDALSEEPTGSGASAGFRCLFRAKRRCITSSQVMNTSAASSDDAAQDRPRAPFPAQVLTAVQQGANSKQVSSSARRENANRKPELRTSTGAVSHKKLSSSQAAHSTCPLEHLPGAAKSSATSSGYCSNSSASAHRTHTGAKSSANGEITRLRIEVEALRMNFKVLELMCSQLSFDFSKPELSSAKSAMLSPICCQSFSPELMEYAIRLAYIDLLSPRLSVSVSAEWLKGIEMITVHVFRYGVASGSAIQYSAGVEKCFRVLSLIAAEIPKLEVLMFRLLELILKKQQQQQQRVSRLSELHRQCITRHTTSLCKNSPRLAIKVLNMLISEFSSKLVDLHHNPNNYAFHRSVTLFYSNLILHILLHLPKGGGHGIMNAVDNLKSIPTNALLLCLAKQDILDHADFIRAP